MILTTRFTFIVEWSWKNMHFHPKLAWLPATYDVISRNHSNWLSLNLTQNLREGWANSYWKRQVLIFYPLGKISEGLMGWGWHPTSLPLLVRPRVKKCRSVILKERDTVNSTVKLSTWRHLTNQSMMPESGIMERRHQRHVARLRRSFSVPIFLFDPVFCLPPLPPPPHYGARSQAIPPVTLHLIYKALIQPHFHYCNVLWGSCGITPADKLQKLQNSAARALTFWSYDADASQLFQNTVYKLEKS